MKIQMLAGKKLKICVSTSFEKITNLLAQYAQAHTYISRNVIFLQGNNSGICKISMHFFQLREVKLNNG